VRRLEFYPGTFCWESIAVAFSLLGYFASMIMVLTAAVGVMIGLFNFSASENVRHYPRPALERNATATHSEPRLFMVAPDTKAASPTKNVEASAAVTPAEKADAKKSKPHRPRVLARQHNNYELPSYGNALGYAEESRNGQRGSFFNW
jgi:hypothetical protein